MLPFILAALPQTPIVAYVLEHEDQWTKSAHASRLLREAGFDVRPLPVGTPPSGLSDGLLVFGSFSSEIDGYAAYVQRHSLGLQEWVGRGNVLLQLTQADQIEAAPPFLPAGLTARRADPDSAKAFVVSAGHALLGGVRRTEFSFHNARTVWEGFADQRGFQVLMSSHPTDSLPALMEAAYGRGRILLSSIPIDKTIAPVEGRSPEGDAAFEEFRSVFFKNLVAYVQGVRSGSGARVVPTPGQSELAEVEPGSWSLVVLPDTQVYAESYPGLFASQTSWIVLNRRRLDVRYVLSLGDITNRNTPEQWKVAREAYSILDGVVPYALTPGNHDYGPGGSASTRDTLMNEYFSFEEQASKPNFGGAFRRGHLENTYHLFEAGGRKWIAFSFEWGPRDAVLEWANMVMERYSDRIGIATMHAYLYSDSTRYDWTKYGPAQSWNPHAYGTVGGVNDGEDIWQKLIRKHNFAFVINGHVLNDGTGYSSERNDMGFTTHEVLANYQFRTLGGEGYLRIFEFSPDGVTVRIKAYSTLYDKFMVASDQSFTVTLDQPIPSGR